MRLAIPLGLIAIAIVSRVDRKEVSLNNNRFVPAIITARVGDTLAFVNGRGGPHNVQFADDSLTDAAHRLIDAAMPERPKQPWSRDVALASPLLVLDGDTYKVVVPALPPGRYRFFCTPHVNGGMRGELIVVPESGPGDEGVRRSVPDGSAATGTSPGSRTLRVGGLLTGRRAS